MNDKHPEDQQDAVPEGEGAPEPGRRQFAKLGLLAPPVILSLASRPVWGTGTQLVCMSEQMSGNLSQRQASCGSGCSPGFWKNKPEAWPSGYTFAAGSNKSTCSLPPGSGRCGPCATFIQNNVTKDVWYGGTTYRQAFPGATIKPTIPTPAGGSDPTDNPLRVVLCKDNGSAAWHLVAALFNSLRVSDYVLTTKQVQDLAKGLLQPPNGMSINRFLDSTWPNCPLGTETNLHTGCP